MTERGKIVQSIVIDSSAPDEDGFVRVLVSKDPTDDILKLLVVEQPVDNPFRPVNHPFRMAEIKLDPSNVADLIAVLQRWLDEEL